MFRRSDVCIVEFLPDAWRASLVRGRKRSVAVRQGKLGPGQEERAAGELAEFVGPRRVNTRTLVLIPRTACLLGAWRLPSKDRGELVGMAELQFSRTTPHRRGEMQVDVRRLNSSVGKSLVSCAMTGRDALQECLDIVGRAGLCPEVVTLNVQRLVPLARRVWGNRSDGRGRILGLCLDGALGLGLFVRGDMLCSREELLADDADKALELFVEYCRKEFPGTTVREALLLGVPAATAQVRSVAGISVGVRELYSLAADANERMAWELCPAAFLDLLLAGDGMANGFDLSPDEVRRERERQRWRWLFRHLAVLAALFLTGAALLGAGALRRELSDIAWLRRELARESGRVRDVEAQARQIAAVGQYLAGRVEAARALADLARRLPPQARLERFELKDRTATLQGEAASLEAVEAFQSALSGAADWREARLDGIDKRPTETSEKVTFRLTFLSGQE